LQKQPFLVQRLIQVAGWLWALHKIVQAGYNRNYFSGEIKDNGLVPLNYLQNLQRRLFGNLRLLPVEAFSTSNVAETDFFDLLLKAEMASIFTSINKPNK
jgi:hypothetical protein